MTKILDVSPTADNTTLVAYGQSVIGRMLALASSQDGQTVFAGSYSNLWVSGDNGQTWDQITWPQPAPGQFGVPGSMGGWLVVDIAVSPVDPQTVLAITRNDRERADRGIWRSTDGGKNWVRVHQFPAHEAVGQLVWAPESDHLVYAAGGSALAISRDGGATFQNELPLGGGQFEQINHVAVGPAPRSAPAPAVVYALGDSKIFVSFDGGPWTQDQGSIPISVGGAVGTDQSQAPSVMVISPRSPLEVFLVGNGSDQDHVPKLWRGDYTQFLGTQQSLWDTVTLPTLGSQDSGNVFIAAPQFGHGDMLFYGGQRSKAYVGPLDPSASDWVELDQDNQVHVDLHGIFLSPDFEGTIENGNYQVSAGTVWLMSDGGIYRSDVDGGVHFKRVKYVRSLSVVNVAGVAYEGLGPALSLNTGDNDGFYSMDGGSTWTSQDYGGGDDDCSYADPMAPNLMLVFTPRWDTSGPATSPTSPDRGTITLYKSEQGGLPDATKSTTQRHVVPGPPQGTGQPAWNAGSIFGLRGSRPIVLTKPGETPAGDGDYVFIRFRTDEKAVVLRTKSLLDIVSRDDWDTLWQVSTSTAQMQIGGNSTSSTPFVTSDGWVYFRGTDDRLLKVFNDGSQSMQIGGNSTSSTPFVTSDGWVYFRGTDDRLLKVFNDGSQSMQIGGNSTSSTPFVTSDGWVYFRGTDDRLLKVFNDGSQSMQIGGNSTSSTPFVTSDGWVYFRGTDDRLLKVFNDGSQSMQIGGNSTSSTPFVTSDGWVYFRGTDDRLLKVFNDGSQSMQIGGNSTSSTPFVTPDGWVYFQGTDDKLWRVFNDGTHQMQIGGNTTASTPFVKDGWVYFQGTDDKLWKVFLPTERQRIFQQGPALPSNDLKLLQASGGHTGTVFYVGGNSRQELWKWTEGMANWERLVPAIPDGLVYFQGTDNKLLKVFNDGSQSMQIGGNSTSSTPFVTSDGWVYFRGTDDRLLKVFNDGSQSMQIGGNSTSSTPFVTSDGWVYFRGTDDRLLKVFNDGSQSMQIGGNSTSSTPFVTSDGWVYFRGTDNKLRKVFNDGSGQMQIGGSTTKSTPFVTSDGWVYFRGTDNKLRKVFNDGTQQMQIGGNTTASTPFVTPDGWVYFRGTDNKLRKVFNDGSGQMQIGGNMIASMPFVTPDGWVYFQGTDDKLWKVFNDGSQQMQIGGNMTASTPFVTPAGAAKARRFFVDPYQPSLIYLLDELNVKRSDDGGKTWQVDFELGTSAFG